MDMLQHSVQHQGDILKQIIWKLKKSFKCRNYSISSNEWNTEIIIDTRVTIHAIFENQFIEMQKTTGDIKVLLATTSYVTVSAIGTVKIAQAGTGSSSSADGREEKLAEK